MSNAIGVVVLGVIIVGAVYIIMFLAGFIVAPLVMFAWNYTMPFLFELPVIGYWQAFWLYILSGLLIKSTQTNNNKGE